MKPLELTVYPPAPPRPPANSNLNLWGWVAERALEGHLRDIKRLTDAELAAEHQRALLDVYRAKVHGDASQAVDRMLTVLRFATLPHHDDPSEACGDSDDHDGAAPPG